MDTTKQAENVSKLIEKAADAEKSEDAMRFSQAATNAANALCATLSALNATKQ